MGAGNQLRDCTMELKELGLRLNKYLYVKGSKHKIPEEEHDLTGCLEELERIRHLIWWLYNDNKSFGEKAGYNLD